MKKNLITKAKEEAKQQMIAIEELHPSRLNTYKVGDVSDLMNSICATGFTSALTVAKSEDGYEVLSGHRRLRAVTLLNAQGKTHFKKLPCIIIDVDGLDDDERLLEIEVANLTHRTIDAAEENIHRFTVMETLKRIADKQENSTDKDFVDAIAQAFGMKDRYARMYRAVFQKGGEEFRKAAENGEASICDLAHLAEMDEEIKTDAIQKIHKMAKEADGISPKTKSRKFIRTLKNTSIGAGGLSSEMINDLYSTEENVSVSATDAFSYDTFAEQAELLLEMELYDIDEEREEIVLLCHKILDYFS